MKRTKKTKTSPRIPDHRVRECGASLIDVLITVTIATVVLAVAIPGARSALEMQRLDASASKLASKLMDARMNAVKRNRQAWLLINSSARTLQVQTTDSSGSTINVGGAEPLSSGVSVGSTPSQVTFTSLGRLAAAQTMTLTGTATGRTKSVTVSVVGQISVGSMN
jgi:Tfp pilus assembly protein FimT